MALIYLGYRKFVKGDKKKKGDDSEEPENKTVESEMEIEKSNAKKKTLVGAGAGAAMGTLICPGIGTAIGAGAGAVAGKLSSKKSKKKPSQKQSSAENVYAQPRTDRPLPETPKPEKIDEPSAPSEEAVYGENLSDRPENIYENIYQTEDQSRGEPRLEYVPSVIPLESNQEEKSVCQVNGQTSSNLYPSLI